MREGEQWVINGSKTFITNGYSADLVIVAARTNPERKAHGITLFGVEATRPGFSRGRKLDKVGQDESDTSELFFEGVRVTEDEIIGELDMGFTHMMSKLPQERLVTAVCNLAHAKQILEERLAYAKERRAFGHPIGTFQHNQFLLAELFTQVEVTQAYIDRCVLAHSAGELSGIDAAKAKWWSSQVQNEVLDHCVQLYGGYGFMNEYRVARAVARRSCLQDLGRLERDHEDADRPRPRPLIREDLSHLTSRQPGPYTCDSPTGHRCPP